MANQNEGASPLQQAIGELKFEFGSVPDGVLRRTVNHVAQAIGEQGGFNMEAQITTYRNVAEYDLSDHIPDGWYFVRSTVVKYCGCCIDPIDKCDPCPHGYDMTSSGCISIYPTPCGEDPIEVCFDVAPELDNCTLPEELFRGKDQMLLNGVRAKLLHMTDKPWTNHRAAAYHERHFDAALVSYATLIALQFDATPEAKMPRII